MTKVVVDTGVMISSFWGGEAREVLALWKSGKVVLCFTKDIINDYTAVLKHLGVGNKELKELYDLIVTNHNIFYALKSSKIQAVKQDPGDNKFIECAFTSKAEFIISTDKDILELVDCFETKIVTPGEFLDIFKVKE